MKLMFLNELSKDESDPRNLIKACPFCGLIWVKVVGCDGDTTCGSPPRIIDKIKNEFSFSTFNYIYSWNEGILNFRREEYSLDIRLNEFHIFRLKSGIKNWILRK